MSPRRVRTAVVLALALAPAACQQAAVSCPPPPPTSGCPDGGGPSFADEVYPNVIQLACVRCHSPGGDQANVPLMTYQQVYGKGVEASEIKFQVFESCLMPPAGQPEVLTNYQRQTLFTWLVACGARPDSPATDGGSPVTDGGASD